MTASVVPYFHPIADERPDDAPWITLQWPVAADTELVGRWVRLSPIDPAVDGVDLFQVLDHEEVWAHVSGRPAGAADFERDLISHRTKPDRCHWTVRAVQDIGECPAGSIIGTTAYLDASVPDARLEVGATLYTPAVWATVVNPETKLLLLSHAFDELGAGRVQLKTDIRNQRSQQAIARLGARYEGTLRRHMRRTDGTIRDSVMFSITAEEWPSVQAGLTARLSAV